MVEHVNAYLLQPSAKVSITSYGGRSGARLLVALTYVHSWQRGTAIGGHISAYQLLLQLHILLLEIFLV